MPSRKKAKGKARKAAKEANEEESRAVVGAAANQRQEESVEAQMQQLRISAAILNCWHGMIFPYEAGNEICLDFINAFAAAFHSKDMVAGQGPFTAAYHATIDKYANVYSSKLDTVISMLLSRGTKCILDGGENNRVAQLFASFASYFEDYMVVRVHKSKAPNISKKFELLGADDHTLVSYYRKRIPCACLDEKYNEVKSVKKIGRCRNTNCRLPGRKVERRKMFYCTRCGGANYCSSECQRADWKKHKEQCDAVVKMKAAFKSNQT